MAKIANLKKKNKHYPCIREALKQDTALFNAFDLFFQKHTVYNLYQDSFLLYSDIDIQTPNDWVIVHLMDYCVRIGNFLNGGDGFKKVSEDLSKEIKDMVTLTNGATFLKALDDAFRTYVLRLGDSAIVDFRNSLFVFHSTANQWNTRGYF